MERQMQNGIKLTEITKDYGTFKLDNISLTLPAGYIMGMIGENGAGKTTLIKTMLGLVRPDAGKVEFFDAPFDPNDPNDPRIKEHIGVVMDRCSFPDDMTVKALERVMANCYATWDSAAFHGFMQRFGLPEDKKIKAFSKGMKMKLSIAQALSHDSRLLILDEATAGLDPVVRDEVLELLQDFIQDENRSVLISSHILSDLEKICDYITFIHNGKVLLCERKDVLMEKYGVVKCSREDFKAIDEAAVAAHREGMFGVEALVERAAVNPAFAVDDASIEDIMVFMIREGNR